MIWPHLQQASARANAEGTSCSTQIRNSCSVPTKVPMQQIRISIRPFRHGKCVLGDDLLAIQFMPACTAALNPFSTVYPCLERRLCRYQAISSSQVRDYDLRHQLEGGTRKNLQHSHFKPPCRLAFGAQRISATCADPASSEAAPASF